MELNLSDAEYELLREAAARVGMTPEEFAEQAISAVIKARYALPKLEGRVLAFARPKRDDTCP